MKINRKTRKTFIGWLNYLKNKPIDKAFLPKDYIRIKDIYINRLNK